MNTIDVTPDSWVGDSAVNNGWKPNGGSTRNYLVYSSYGRMKAGTPSLTCSNKNDSFTVEESETGNGALTYPVGLITADEMNLAGCQLNTVANTNTDFYLYTNQNWWAMSPGTFFNDYAFEFFVLYAGRVYSDGVGYSIGVRPSISLKPGVKVREGGDESSATPYEFIVG